jgi:uncharacterized protein YcnI
MSVRVVTAVAAVLALGAAAPAGAHVILNPSFVAADGLTTLELTVPNERRVPMTGFVVQVPADFRARSAHSAGAWIGTVGGRSASWHGGSVAARRQATFELELEAPSAPGSATFQMEQHYPDGGVVRWPVPLTVVPADEPAQQLGLALVAGIGLLLVLALVGVLLWRRTSSSLQER